MNLMLLFPIIISFLITLLVMPSWISKAKKFGFTGKDMNKFEKSEVAEGGGLIAVTGAVIGILIYIAIKTFYFKSRDNLVEILALITSILILAIIGLADGSLGWRMGLGRKTRILFCFFAAIPLMVINAGNQSINLPFFGIVNLGIFYPLILIPIGIIATSTTFNFLAGFNGLEAGQGAIILASLAFVCYKTGNTWLSLICLIIVACLIAFLIFNKYPAEVFPGDVLTYPLGGIIGIIAILGKIELISIFFYIPYIFEVILKSRGKLVKQSFGNPNNKQELDLPYEKVYGITHLSIWICKKLGVKATEKNVVRIIYAFQIFFIALALILFRETIF